jgi:large subunit ribosomal protein L31
MREGIHPTYYPDAKVTCSCGHTWTTGSTQKELRVDICSHCHPFFSGETQRIVDIEGQVDRFYKKLQARQDYVEENKVRQESKTSPKRPIAELELGKRPTEALASAGITMVGQFMDKLSEGEEGVLAISGFGRTSLINLKKKLRSLGYEVPEAEAA